MIRTLRAFFLSRVLREKLLLVGFLGIAVIMWASSFSSRAMGLWRAEHATTAQLKDQDFWLNRRGEIEAATKKAAAQMDPTRTLDATGLAVTVRELATNAGVHLTSLSGATSPVPGGPFSINTQRFNIQNTDWHSFAEFYQHLQERAPYIGIQELVMTPVRGNSAQVQAQLTVASFEIKH